MCVIIIMPSNKFILLWSALCLNVSSLKINIFRIVKVTLKSSTYAKKEGCNY